MFSKLGPDKLQQAEFARMVWVIVPEVGISLETILRPEYWSHVSKRLAPWHRIEVRDPGFGWVAELIVRDCGQNWAKVELLEATHFERRSATGPVLETTDNPDYEIKWRAAAQWSVMRKIDGAVMKDGFSNSDEANLWLRHHIAKLAA